MRSLPYDFARKKDLQENAIIDLLIVEVISAYVSDIGAVGADKKSIRISQKLTERFALLIDSGIDVYGEGDGYAWTLTVESGINVGTSRVITNYTVVDGYGWLHFNEPLVFTPVFTGRDIDKVRISKNLFLAKHHKNIEFFLPDNSATITDHAITYIPFPMSIEPIGTNTTGEILSMKADVANVNRYIGNLIQEANGLRGNRVIFMRTFDEVYIKGRHFALLDVMYIDSVNISADTVSFSFESKFNIVGLNLPRGNYMRNFCRHVFKDFRCAWTMAGIGLDTNYKYANKMDATITTSKIGEVACDHSLMGPNGCLAHKNSRRFGGFPSIPAK